jgi:hypothetical protein
VAQRQVRLVRRRLLVLPVLLASMLPAAACSPGRAPGPLGNLLVQGQPSFGVDSGVVAPGQPQDGEVFVVNTGNAPATITAVSAIEVPGQPAARLAGVGVAITGGVAGARGWPPPAPVKVKPAIGAKIPHEENGIGIIFGITGPVIGHNYAVAGLRISYTFNGQPYTVLLWGGDMACVEVNASATSPTCNTFYNKVNTAIEKMSGLT